MPEWFRYLLLFGGGLVAGTLNVVAGGGSFLTLPILIFLGLPPTVANATNRVGILVQNIGAVWGFNRHRVLEWRWAALAVGPALAGSLLGTWGALRIGDEAFRRVLALLMVGVTLWTLLAPRPQQREGAPDSRRRLLLGLAFFAVGVYGGFVQAGVGFFILAVTSLGGLDLVRGNAVKVLTILCFTALSLAIFVSQGMVQWLPGLVLAGGTLLGGQLGVRLTVLKGHAWVRRVVAIAIVVFAIKLWLGA